LCTTSVQVLPQSPGQALAKSKHLVLVTIFLQGFDLICC